MSCLRSTTATHSRLPSRASRGGRYRYLTGLTWPYDTVNAQAARDNALGLVEQDPNLPPGQTATFENELTADIASYAVSGTPDYLTAQFAARSGIWTVGSGSLAGSRVRRGSALF